MTYEEILNMVGGDYGNLVDLLYSVAKLTGESGVTINRIVDALDEIDDEYIADKFRAGQKGHIPLYFVEVGVLLTEENEEYDSYQINGFHEEYGFYDENRCAYFDFKRAKEYADKYVADGVIGTYAVIHYTVINTDHLSDRDVIEIINSACYDDIPNPTLDALISFQSKVEDGSCYGWYYDETKVKS